MIELEILELAAVVWVRVAYTHCTPHYAYDSLMSFPF
jgi:hypothetical protein